MDVFSKMKITKYSEKERQERYSNQRNKEEKKKF